MKSVAAWLVARPLNAIIGLAATQSLPLFGFLSGAVLVLLVLHQGPRLAVLEAGAAGALMLVLTVILGLPLEPKVTVMTSAWLPAMLVSLLLSGSRSLTLTLQVTVVVMVAVVLALFAVAGNAVEFWTTFLDTLVEAWRENGLEEQARFVEPQIGTLAQHMTVWVVFVTWGLSAVMLLLGHGLYRRAPGASRDFGRFQDLDFGRVIAATMAVASLVAFLTGIMWLQSVAFALFAVFSLQGIAIVHWYYGNGTVPVFLVVLMYAGMVVLSAIVVTALAVLGYIDAWFSLRRQRIRPGV